MNRNSIFESEEVTVMSQEQFEKEAAERERNREKRLKEKSERVKRMLTEEEQKAQEEAYEKKKADLADELAKMTPEERQAWTEKQKENKKDPGFLVYTIEPENIPAKPNQQVKIINFEQFVIDDDEISPNANAAPSPVPNTEGNERSPAVYEPEIPEPSASELAITGLLSPRKGAGITGMKRARDSEAASPQPAAEVYSSHDGTPTSPDSFDQNSGDPDAAAELVRPDVVPDSQPIEPVAAGIIWDSKQSMLELCEKNQQLVGYAAFGKYKLLPIEDHYKKCNPSCNMPTGEKPCFVTSQPTDDWRELPWVAGQTFRTKMNNKQLVSVTKLDLAMLRVTPLDEFQQHMRETFKNWPEEPTVEDSGKHIGDLIILAHTCLYGDDPRKGRAIGLQVWFQDPVTKEVFIPGDAVYENPSPRAVMTLNVLVVTNTDTGKEWFIEMTPTTEKAIEDSVQAARPV